ncbi:MAG: DUF488 domain-containing protein [Syntrophales bacterium]|jgi:uncharacterized protein (DUF488 family)|nr:DUF488 domain-containing protein [Syntrophales bacterium]MCK9528812.1 DUF488 domain-containing protein [Syntrophales bacterium]MDX9922759.1 DUF488 domain-containing protein [Syntrophales bacterium]
MKSEIYTIGHSNYEITVFMDLLRRHDITALGDVRSHPYSRYVPQYSREPLKTALTAAGIAYVFLGKELGARSENPACYKQGRVQYERLAKEPIFLEGIDRVVQGINRYRIALMCAEKDPIECHRALLVARKLSETGIPVNHILTDGSLESHEAMESRLLAVWKLSEGDMFKSREEFMADAYLMQGERVAYQDETMAKEERVAVS